MLIVDFTLFDNFQMNYFFMWLKLLNHDENKIWLVWLQKHVLKIVGFVFPWFSANTMVKMLDKSLFVDRQQLHTSTSRILKYYQQFCTSTIISPKASNILRTWKSIILTVTCRSHIFSPLTLKRSLGGPQPPVTYSLLQQWIRSMGGHQYPITYSLL